MNTNFRTFKNTLFASLLFLFGGAALAQTTSQEALLCCGLKDALAMKAQVPGYYRMALGKIEITALFDGVLELDTQLLKNTQPAELNHRLASLFVGNPKMQTAVNTYLVKIGKDDLLLVDTGAGKSGVFGPSLGFMLENMKAAGYDPKDVKAILLTHLHPDHLAGAVDIEGKPVFPNAKVFASQVEHNFWLSEEIAKAAPKEAQPFFKMARDIASSYKTIDQWMSFTEEEAATTPLARDDSNQAAMKGILAYGHTPGHMAYEIESEGQKLLIWGDVVHAHAIQFANPGVSIEFDIDQKEAIATRRALMKKLAKSGSLVAGAHLPFPGIGHIRADGSDAYTFVPIEFSPMPMNEAKR